MRRLVVIMAASAMSVCTVAPAHAAPTWLAPVDLSADNEVSAIGKIAAAPDGTAVSTWEAFLGGHFVVRAARRRPGATVEPAKTISTTTSDADYVDVGIDDAGNATVVWEETTPAGARRVRAARLPATSGDFEAAQTVSDASVQSVRPAIGVGGGGAAVVAWVQTPDSAATRVLKSATRAGQSGAFVDVRSISAVGLDISTTQIAVNPRGDAVAIWSASAGGDGFVQVNDRPAGGDFAATGRTVSSGALGESASEPAVVLDPAGRATALWNSSQTAAVQYAERSSSGEWSDPAGASQPGDIGSSPVAAVAADGTVVAAWFAGAVGVKTVKSAIRRPGGGFAEHGDLSGALTSPDALALAMSPGGDAIVTWMPVNQRAIYSRYRPRGGTFQPLQVAAQEQNPEVSFIFPDVGMDDEGNSTAVWTREINVGGGQRYRLQGAGHDVAPPTLGAVSVPSGTTAGSAADMSATATDRWSPATIAWDFGDGTGAAGATVSHVFGVSGAFGVTVSATDAAGNTSTAIRSLLVSPAPIAPPPPSPPVPVPVPVAIPRPAAKPVTIVVTLAFDYKALRRNTRFKRLVVKGVPTGATVTATCPRGCVRKRFVKRNASGSVSLTALVARPVAVGRVITVVVSRPGEIAAVKRLTIRARKGPLVSTRCLPPGAKRPGAC